MMFRVFNDLHILGPLELFSFEELLFKIKSSPYLVVLNGDIIDIKNCRKKDIELAKSYIKTLRELPNVTYIGGNHEGWEVDKLNAIIGNCYFDHSDLLEDASKWLEFRGKPNGAGFLHRRIITPTIDLLRHFWATRPSQECLDKLQKIKEQNPQLTDAILAHSHPDHIIEFRAGMRCRILMRGITDIST